MGKIDGNALLKLGVVRMVSVFFVASLINVERIPVRPCLNGVAAGRAYELNTFRHRFASKLTVADK